MTPDLRKYLLQELNKKKSSEEIKQAMLSGGWPEQIIDESLQELKTELALMPKKSGMNSLLLLSICIFCIIGAGSFLAYIYIFNTPENMLNRMENNLEMVKSYSYKGSLSATVTANDPSTDTVSFLKPLQQVETALGANSVYDMSIGIDGQWDKTLKENQKSAATISLHYKPANDAEVNAGLEMRAINKSLYLKVNKIPDLPEMNGLGVLQNQWIKLDSSAARSVYPFGSEFAMATDSAEITKIKENKEKIKQTYAKHKFIVFDKTVSTETVNSVETKHYSFSIDKKKLKEFYLEFFAMLTDSKINESETDYFDYVKSINGEIWVGKADTLPYKLKLALTMSSDQQKTSVQLNTEVEFKDYNKPINITEPTDAKSIDDLRSQVLESGLAGTSSLYAKARDSKRLSDLTALRNAIDASQVMNTSFKLPVCTPTSDQKKCSSMGYDSTKYNGDVSWIPADLHEYIASQPIDPSNDEQMITLSGKKVSARYIFRSNGTTYKLATYIEDPSNKHWAANDGGTDPDLFETGTNLSLSL